MARLAHPPGPLRRWMQQGVWARAALPPGGRRRRGAFASRTPCGGAGGREQRELAGQAGAGKQAGLERQRRLRAEPTHPPGPLKRWWQQSAWARAALPEGGRRRRGAFASRTPCGGAGGHPVLESQWHSKGDSLSTSDDGRWPYASERKLAFARQLRKRQTPAEQILWKHLRRHRLGGFKFRRQHVLIGFIVDFYCRSAKLVVEVDGPMHDFQIEADRLREEKLRGQGLEVLRVTNADVTERLGQVLTRIHRICQDRAAG